MLLKKMYLFNNKTECFIISTQIPLLFIKLYTMLTTYMDKNEIMRFFTKKNSPVVSVVIFFIFYVKKERNLITDYYFNHFSDMNLAF